MREGKTKTKTKTENKHLQLLLLLWHTVAKIRLQLYRESVKTADTDKWMDGWMNEWMDGWMDV